MDFKDGTLEHPAGGPVYGVFFQDIAHKLPLSMLLAKEMVHLGVQFIYGHHNLADVKILRDDLLSLLNAHFGFKVKGNNARKLKMT